MFLQPSNARLAALIALYSVHSVISAVTLTEFSPVGLVRQAFLNWGTGQIFSDLAFALTLVCAWLVADARRRDVLAWPWLIGTLLFGCLSPGLYLILREWTLLRDPTARRGATA